MTKKIKINLAISKKLKMNNKNTKTPVNMQFHTAIVFFEKFDNSFLSFDNILFLLFEKYMIYLRNS